MFDLNRSADRIASVMQNDMAMPQASAIFHHNIAHIYPVLADRLTEIKDRWNLSSVYGETHEDGRDYSELLPMFQTFLDENVEAYEMIKLAYKVAEEEGDFNVQADLVEFMQTFNKIIAQVITLRDKADQMPAGKIGFAKFDQYSSNFGIDGLGE